jgi:hypothetical protein
MEIEYDVYFPKEDLHKVYTGTAGIGENLEDLWEMILGDRKIVLEDSDIVYLITKERADGEPYFFKTEYVLLEGVFYRAERKVWDDSRVPSTSYEKWNGIIHRL